MSKALVFSLAGVLLLLAPACAPVTPVVQSPTPPTEMDGPYHPLAARSGIEPVDRVLDAVSSGDRQALFSVVEYTAAVCTTREGMGGPPKCREGEAEGTPVDVLPFLSSEGHHMRRDEIEQWTGIDATGIYAVYEVNQAVISSEQYFPVGQYAILLLTAGSEPGVALRIGESGIVRVDTIFDASPQALNEMVEREASQVILAPVGQ